MSPPVFRRYPHFVSIVCYLLLASLMQGEELVSPIEQGQQLFTHVWRVNDELSPNGDGLGPLHNATSCVECHIQGGVGGAGSVSNNVELLAVASTPSKGKVRIAMHTELVRINPIFKSRPNLVFHKKSTLPDYDLFRLRISGMQAPKNLSSADKTRMGMQLAVQQSSHPSPRKFQCAGIEFQLSQRNTPALFGLGLINAISSNEIRDEATRQANSSSNVKGRVAIPNPRPRQPARPQPERSEPPFVLPNNERLSVGRFGWRGQIASLEEFVLGACANELGLEVSNTSQPINPLGPSYRAPGVDLNAKQCEALIAFVSSLPRPVQIKPDDPSRVALVDLGERSFHEIGCADCHIQKFGNVDGLYSDLLLHDMGPQLADLVAVNSAKAAQFQPSTSGGYSGGSNESFTQAPVADRQAWRTPPLWGVYDSAPYLHDGRAQTLREAIVIHGGEARPARLAFLRLSASEQANVIAFLQTLSVSKTPADVFVPE